MSMFPHRVQIGSTPYGLDADHADHASDGPAPPELEVTSPDVVGVLWAPDGGTYREVYGRGVVEFGFRAKGGR